MSDIIIRLIPGIISLLSSIFPLLLIGGAILILSNALNGWKKRAPAYERLAREVGLIYSSGEDLSNIHGAEYFRLFNLGSKYNRQIQNLARGTINNLQVSIFDYTYYVAFSNRKTHRQTVVMIESPRISVPLFSLKPRPKGFLQRINLGSGKNMDFPQDSTFSSKYEMLGYDERRIRQLFNASILHVLGETENLNLEGGGSRFLFYFDGRLIAPEQLRPMLDKGLQIVRAFGF